MQTQKLSDQAGLAKRLKPVQVPAAVADHVQDVGPVWHAVTPQEWTSSGERVTECNGAASLPLQLRD